MKQRKKIYSQNGVIFQSGPCVFRCKSVSFGQSWMLIFLALTFLDTTHFFYIDAWLPDGRLAAVCACEADARGPIEHLEQLHWGLTLFPMSQWCTFKTDLLVKLQIFHFCQVEWISFSPLLKNENFSSVLTELRSLFRLFFVDFNEAGGFLLQIPLKQTATSSSESSPWLRLMSDQSTCPQILLPVAAFFFNGNADLQWLFRGSTGWSQCV